MFVFWEGVQLDPILEPGDVGPGFAPGHAHQTDLPAKVEHLPVVRNLQLIRSGEICGNESPFVLFFPPPREIKGSRPGGDSIVGGGGICNYRKWEDLMIRAPRLRE